MEYTVGETKENRADSEMVRGCRERGARGPGEALRVSEQQRTLMQTQARGDNDVSAYVHQL